MMCVYRERDRQERDREREREVRSRNMKKKSIISEQMLVPVKTPGLCWGHPKAQSPSLKQDTNSPTFGEYGGAEIESMDVLQGLGRRGAAQRCVWSR